jgi:copper chaperone CopZ
MVPAPRRVRVLLDGLVAVHAARAAHTALGAVPGVITAQVTLAGAELEMDGPVEVQELTRAMNDALAPIGISVSSCVVESSRSLPIA